MLSDDVLFTNLVEVEENGMAGTGESTTGGCDENVQLAYRPLYDVKKVCSIYQFKYYISRIVAVFGATMFLKISWN